MIKTKSLVALCFVMQRGIGVILVQPLGCELDYFLRRKLNPIKPKPASSIAYVSGSGMGITVRELIELIRMSATNLK